MEQSVFSQNSSHFYCDHIILGVMEWIFIISQCFTRQTLWDNIVSL